MKTSILNSNRVVDARDHRLQSVVAAKNGANPKSQTSRGNFIRKVNQSEILISSLTNWFTRKKSVVGSR